MAISTDRKLYLGARLRRLRRELGLSQTRMAEEIAISPSYLNHLERNQRPVTAQVLLKLTEAFDIDLRDFIADTETPGAGELAEVFADPLFRDLAIPRHDLVDLADNAPGAAEALLRLYRAYIDKAGSADVNHTSDQPARASLSAPVEWVQDFIQARHNHFPEIEERAEALAATIDNPSEDQASQLRHMLNNQHRISVRVVPADVLDNSLRHYDYHRRRLLISELLGPAGRTFAMAYQLALIDMRQTLDALVSRAGPPDGTSERLLRTTLARYAAGAIVMPYTAFHVAAENNRYDIDLLCRRFGVSFEQACHRLTTLGRSGARGVPFFMIRTDASGNVSKRFAAGSLPFARFGGICPRWNIQSAFRSPGLIITQIIEMPDGARYFTLSRTVRRAAPALPGEHNELALGLGCELRHAPRLIYALGLDLTDPITVPTGPACVLCERPLCTFRAMLPANRKAVVDELTRPATAYPFMKA